MYVCRDRLVQNPPTKFYQEYYQCHPDQMDTLTSSFGVVAGNMSIVLPIALALLLILRLLDKVPMEDVYTEEEEETTAARMLAEMLLRLRDKRPRCCKTAS